MKKTLILSAVLLVSTICYSQKSYQLYTVKLKAYEIIGGRKDIDFDNPKADNGLNNYLNPALRSTNLYASLGSIYSSLNNSSLYNLSPFLNTDQDGATVLDEINSRYIMAYEMKRLHKQHGEDKDFLAFQAAYSDPKLTPSERSSLLNDGRYSVYNKEIEDSKYETYLMVPIDIKINAGGGFKLSLVADIAAAISKIVDISGSTADSLSNTIQRSVTASDMKFYQIELNVDYIKSASAIIRKYWEDKDLLLKLNKPDMDDFSNDLYNYLNSENEGIVSYVSLFSATFTTTKKTDLELAIGASIGAKITPANKDTVNATIKAAIDHSVKDSLTISPPKAYYIINYGVDNKLELGKGAPISN